MNQVEKPRLRLVPPLAGLALLAMALGVAFEMLGVVLPAPLLSVLGATSSFGAMAKIGGGVALVALALIALGGGETAPGTDKARGAPDPAPRRTGFADNMESLQMRLARRAAEPEPASAAVARPRLGARLQRGALVLVTVALAALLAASLVTRLAGAR